MFYFTAMIFVFLFLLGCNEKENSVEQQQEKQSISDLHYYIPDKKKEENRPPVKIENLVTECDFPEIKSSVLGLRASCLRGDRKKNRLIKKQNRESCQEKKKEKCTNLEKYIISVFLENKINPFFDKEIVFTTNTILYDKKLKKTVFPVYSRVFCNPDFFSSSRMILSCEKIIKPNKEVVKIKGSVKDNQHAAGIALQVIKKTRRSFHPFIFSALQEYNRYHTEVDYFSNNSRNLSYFPEKFGFNKSKERVNLKSIESGSHFFIHFEMLSC